MARFLGLLVIIGLNNLVSGDPSADPVDQNFNLVGENVCIDQKLINKTIQVSYMTTKRVKEEYW